MRADHTRSLLHVTIALFCGLLLSSAARSAPPSTFRLGAASGGVPPEIDWLAIGDPGNAADTTGFGAVAYPYEIARFEVTNAQYAVFLNAVAAADANSLYNTSMASGFGGITRSGSSGSFSYSAVAGREDKPVDYVSFWDALRFANWLHNGQPLGAQDDTTTEEGAYTLTIPGVSNRNSEAAVFLTSEDEWYKAAYYDGASGYFDFPTGSDVVPACETPAATANTANCDNAVGDLTDVGGYTGAASPSGTFDQAGNVQEWTEGILGSNRVLRGAGSFNVSGALSGASTQSQGLPTVEIANAGFRVARLTPPAVPSMRPLGLALLASLLGFAFWRKLP